MSIVSAKQQVSISPIDNSVFSELAYASEQEIDKCLEQADLAVRDLANLDLDARIKICQRALDYFSSNKLDMAREITIQMGRPLTYAPLEIDTAIARAEHMLAIAKTALAPKIIEDTQACSRYIERAALGVVFVVAPWNYPYLTAINTIIPAILAGNSVILKHSAQTPLCADRFVRAFGFYPGCIQTLCLDHAQVSKLVTSDLINFVAFTGSVSGGRAISQAASSKFMNLGLELGGKDPAYVRADVDLNFAVENIVDGAFFNSGQSCCAVERIYVHKRVYKDFVAAFVDKVTEYEVGNPLHTSTTLGPMVKPAAADFVREQISHAVKHGAKALINGADSQSNRAYCQPEVLINVDHSMAIMHEETFGPAVGIMPVANDQQAIEFMNDSAFGLTASIWSQDKSAVIAMLKQIKTGTCFMNRCDYLDPALSWSGIKDSGTGCSLSEYGFLQLTRPKSFHLRSA